MPRWLPGAALLLAALALGACGRTPAPDGASDGAGGFVTTAPGTTSGDLSTPGATTAPVTATLVVRLPATATSTATPDPLAPVPVEELPGIVVPLSAVAVDVEAATDEQDGQAEFTIQGMDEDDLREWFRAHLPDEGWEEDEERDGDLIFLHSTQLSARYAGEGLHRTATILFGMTDAPEDGAAFTVVAEAPEGAPAPTPTR